MQKVTFIWIHSMTEGWQGIWSRLRHNNVAEQHDVNLQGGYPYQMCQPHLTLREIGCKHTLASVQASSPTTTSPTPLVPHGLPPVKKKWLNGMSMWSWRISLTDNWPQAQPIQASLRQDSKKENLQEPLTAVDNGRGKDKCMVSTLPTSWVDYKSCLFTNVWLQNFDLCKCSTLQFSVSHLPTSHDDSFPMNHVPNLLDGESKELVSSDSKGYVETEVD